MAKAQKEDPVVENVKLEEPVPAAEAPERVSYYVTLTGAALHPDSGLMCQAGAILDVTREQAVELLRAGKIARPSFL